MVKHLIEFALPSKKRANAAEVVAKGAPAVAGSRSTTQGAVAERTRSIGDDNTQADNASSSAATDHVSKPKKRLRKNDEGGEKDTCGVILSQDAAQAMADSFFKFVFQEHLQQHLSRMSAGQILVLCIFHSRLSWQKGKPLQLHERDHYWIPKPSYTPASQVHAPSPPHFVQRIKHSATEHVPPEMQPPCSCCLCGKGFIDSPALWKHCELEHHSWAEAAKRTLWEAEQLEAMPLLPPDKRRIIQTLLTRSYIRSQRKAILGATKSA